MEYCGEVLSQETTLERMNTVYKDMKHYYFLDYSKGEVVDGCQKGTIARFVIITLTLTTRLITLVNLIAGLRNGLLEENIVLAFFLKEKLNKEKN